AVRSPRSPARRVVRRRTAARGRGAGAHSPPDPAAGRRADRQPRPPHRRRRRQVTPRSAPRGEHHPRRRHAQHGTGRPVSAQARHGRRQPAIADDREQASRNRNPPRGLLNLTFAMTLKRLRLRNLLFHWRGNLAVFLGVVVGTAVLTGALLVGDSLHGSLRDLTLRRLGLSDQHSPTPPSFPPPLPPP